MVAGRDYKGWHVWFDDFIKAWFASKAGETIGPMDYDGLLAAIRGLEGE